MITENTIVIVISSIECELTVCVTGGWREQGSEWESLNCVNGSETRFVSNSSCNITLPPLLDELVKII